MSPYNPADRRRKELARERAKHRECPGCGELMDECRCRNSNPLRAFDIDAPERAITIHLDKDDDE